jgi:hypothetical protein
VYLEGNPIEKKELCNVMACLAMNPGLIKVNGKVLTKQVLAWFVCSAMDPSTAHIHTALHVLRVFPRLCACAQEKQLVVTLDRPVMRMALQQGWMLSASVNNGAGL